MNPKSSPWPLHLLPCVLIAPTLMFPAVATAQCIWSVASSNRSVQSLLSLSSIALQTVSVNVICSPGMSMGHARFSESELRRSIHAPQP